MKATVFLFCLLSSVLYCQNDSDIYYMKSVDMFNEKFYEKSLDYIDKALEIDSLNKKNIYQKLKILCHSSKTREGKFELLDQVSEIINNSYDDEFLYYYCLVYDSIGESGQGTKILKLYVNSKRFKDPEMILFLAQRLINDKKIEESIPYYETYLKLYPDDLGSNLDFVNLLFTVDKRIEAKELLDKLNTKNPDNLIILNLLKSFYLAQKEYLNALNYQDKIIKIENTPSRIIESAKIKELLGDKKSAYLDYLNVAKSDGCNLDYIIKILNFE